MGNKKLHLLNSKKKNPFSISLFVFYVIVIMQYVAWRWQILLNSHNNSLSLSKSRLNISIILQLKWKINIFSGYKSANYSMIYLALSSSRVSNILRQSPKKL